MAEPEELIIDAARHATAFVSRLWSRPGVKQDDIESLPVHKHLLELLLAAAYATDIPVHVAQPPAPVSVLSRLFAPVPPHLAEPYALPANNGVQIFLPMRLALDPFASDETSSLKLFRVLALQQAGRARRRAASACLPTVDADM